MLQFEKATIIDGLSALARKDPKFKLFGSVSHRYRLNRPLSGRVFKAFEKKYKVSFPRDYRYFITTIGNGGAGPYYGVLRFGMTDLDEKWDKSCLIGDLSKPFPHTKAWTLPKSFWANEPRPSPSMPEDEEERLQEAWMKVLEKHYWDTALMNGAIPICELGCNYRQWLVVKGKQKGFIWCDYRAGDGPGKAIFPLRNARGKQLTFAEWYLFWLREPRKAMELD